MLCLPLAALAAPLGAGSAQAQGRLEARYTATLAGIPLGKGAWVVDIADSQYTAAGSGMTTGLLRIFSSGSGTSAARGSVLKNQFVPVNYAASLTVDKKTEDVRMQLNSGSVTDFSIVPPPPVNPERVPVTENHRRGVIDPMTGSLVPMPGNGDLLTPEACKRPIAIFDGRMRYDFTFSYKRIEHVKAGKGYEGPVVVCAIYFAPVAGFLPNRSAIKYLIAQRDMEVWLAPIAGTRVLVPYRLSVPTPLGLAALEATHFISTAQPPRPIPASVKTQ